MSGPRKTAIVTGASQGIGAGIVKRFVERGSLMSERSGRSLAGETNTLFLI